MDEIDYRILRELQFNARLSNADLASLIGLSASPCWNRVRTLEQQGVIEKYIAIFNQAALGLPDTVIIEVTLDRHDDDILNKFEAALERMPKVVEAYLMTGEYDFFIKVAVAGTEGYERFLREKLYKIPGIRHSRTSFTLRRLKQTYSVQPPSPIATDRPSDRPSRRPRRGFAR
jgi:Lrp/AsnC family transcriptional regulator, leucine-responsive regulatory protein